MADKYRLPEKILRDAAEYGAVLEMPQAALEDVFDCIEGKYSYEYTANLLREQHNIPLSTERYAAIKHWIGSEEK